MAPKTTIVNGTIVQPDYLNALNNQVPDGQDEDGHFYPVDLAADADGLSLPRVSGRARYENLPPSRLFGFKSLGSVSHDADSLAHFITVGQMSLLAQNSYGRGSISCQNMIEISASLRKQIINSTGDGWQSWTSGADGGAVPSGASGWSQAIGDGVWLHIFALGLSTDYSYYEVGVDTSLVATNLREVASAYDIYRRIGSIYIYQDTTYKIMPFFNYGNRWKWTDTSLIDPVLSISSATISSTQSLVSAMIPPGVRVLATLHTRLIVSGTCQVLFSASDYLEDSGNKDILYDVMLLEGEISKLNLKTVLSNTSQQVLLYRESTTTVDSLVVRVCGWEENVY